MKTVIKLALCFTLCLSTSAYAVSTIVTNDPPPVTLAPDAPGGNVYTISGAATTVGDINLFHSFNTFNIGAGDTVNFTSTDSFKNVIVSVTGGLSTIDGALKSSILGADFYFINPAGVIFGEHAVINVPAAFHVSTASSMGFVGGLEFNTSTPVASIASGLKIAAPESFGFVADSNSSVTVAGSSSGSTLSVNPGQTFDIVANNINIGSSTTKANLEAPSGEIRLVAFKGTDTVDVDASSLPAQNLLATNGGDIIINSGSSVNSPGGQIGLWANNINVNNASVSADSTATSSGSVTVAGSTVDVTNGSNVRSSGGQIDLSGSNININNATVSADSTAANSGYLTVTGSTVNVSNLGAITTSTSGTDKPAGNIEVNANILNIAGTGKKDEFTGISSSSNGGGKAGTVTINSDTVNIVNAGSITSSALASGDAGNVSVISKTMNIDGQKNDTGNTAFTGISSSAVTGTGDGGTVTVNTDILNIQDGGVIRTATFTDGNASKPDTTSVTVTANVLTIDAQGNTSTPTGITSRANGFAVTGIPTDYTKKGDAGKVVVNAGSLKILNSGQISTDTFTEGDAGTVTVNANSIVVDGVVTNSSGVEFPSKISSASRSSSKGYTGDVTVTASQSIQVQNGGQISIKSEATVPKPLPTNSKITISAPDINLTSSKITSEAKQNDNAGDINVNFSHWLTMNSSFITTTANTGNGGIITINGGEAIYLENSGFLTSVSGATSNGGNINVNADALIMNTAVIQANAVGGSGGDINIALKALIPSQNRLIVGGKRVLWQPNIPGFNVIQAASESGVSGTVNVNSPQFDISGSVSGLDTSGLVLPSIAQNPCASQGTRSSSLARGSKGGIPVSESKAGFIPPASALSDTKAKTQTTAEKSVSNATVLPADSVTAQNDSSCAPI